MAKLLLNSSMSYYGGEAIPLSLVRSNRGIKSLAEKRFVGRPFRADIKGVEQQGPSSSNKSLAYIEARDQAILNPKDMPCHLVD
jgi:hypothetical protein